MRKAENWKHFSQKRPIYIITAKFQNGLLFIKFWNITFHYVTVLSIFEKLFYESIDKFGATLSYYHQINFQKLITPPPLLLVNVFYERPLG